MEADLIASACLWDVWASLSARGKFRFFRPEQYTVLAGIVLSRPPDSNEASFECTCISIGTGSKCLPQSLLPQSGDALHDSHAEIIARRGAIRWILEEIRQCRDLPDYSSKFMCRSSGGLWCLKEGIRVNMYVSHLPCGDASMLSLSREQDPEMAALKSTNVWPATSPGSVIRGRNNYSAFGALRTKPGRSDSSPSLSMSCSDKIASWTCLGVQGALLAGLTGPIYLDSIVVGSVATEDQALVRTECERAFSLRHFFDDNELPLPFRFNPPAVHFTNLEFPHGSGTLLCNECVTWNAHTGVEILINGRVRGVSNKSKNTKRPALCRASLFEMFQRISPLTKQTIYQEAKMESRGYQEAKKVLRTEGGPLWGWVVTSEDRSLVSDLTPYSANSVILTGDFDNWNKTIPLTKAGDSFSTVVEVPYDEVVHYKFFVDGEWRLLENQPTERTPQGFQNNILRTPPKPVILDDENSVIVPPKFDAINNGAVVDPEGPISNVTPTVVAAHTNGQSLQNAVTIPSSDNAVSSEHSPAKASSLQEAEPARDPMDLIDLTTPSEAVEFTPNPPEVVHASAEDELALAPEEPVVPLGQVSPSTPTSTPLAAPEPADSEERTENRSHGPEVGPGNAIKDLANSAAPTKPVEVVQDISNAAHEFVANGGSALQPEDPVISLQAEELLTAEPSQHVPTLEPEAPLPAPVESILPDEKSSIDLPTTAPEPAVVLGDLPVKFNDKDLLPSAPTIPRLASLDNEHDAPVATTEGVVGKITSVLAEVPNTVTSVVHPGNGRGDEFAASTPASPTVETRAGVTSDATSTQSATSVLESVASNVGLAIKSFTGIDPVKADEPAPYVELEVPAEKYISSPVILETVTNEKQPEQEVPPESTETIVVNEEIPKPEKPTSLLVSDVPDPSPEPLQTTTSPVDAPENEPTGPAIPVLDAAPDETKDLPPSHPEPVTPKRESTISDITHSPSHQTFPTSSSGSAGSSPVKEDGTRKKRKSFFGKLKQEVKHIFHSDSSPKK